LVGEREKTVTSIHYRYEYKEFLYSMDKESRKNGTKWVRRGFLFAFT
jgi:hypothetical protein